MIGTRQQKDDDDGFGAAQYTKARAVREHYQARLAKIEYEERVGKVVVERRGPGRGFQQVPDVPRRDAEHPRPHRGDACRGDGRSEVLRDPRDRDPEGAQ